MCYSFTAAGRYPYLFTAASSRIISRNMHKPERHETWHPCENLLSIYKETNYAVIILNTPIQFKVNSNFLLNLWSQAKVRITVDGGTERWLAWLKQNNIDYSKVSQPELVTGDMDSLSQDILHYFIKNEYTTVVSTPNQDETDFTKALRELATYCCGNQREEVDTVYVIADTCGRFDQIIANVNTLYKANGILPKVKIFQIASNSISWLLMSGSHTISVPLNLRRNKEWCALMPIGTPSHVSTTGLKWNLDKKKMEFGGIVSTSNTYDGSSLVTVQTENPIVWSMGIATLFD